MQLKQKVDFTLPLNKKKEDEEGKSDEDCKKRGVRGYTLERRGEGIRRRVTMTTERNRIRKQTPPHLPHTSSLSLLFSRFLTRPPSEKELEGYGGITGGGRGREYRPFPKTTKKNGAKKLASVQNEIG